MKEDLLVFYRWLPTPLSQPLYASYNTYAGFTLINFKHLRIFIFFRRFVCLLFGHERPDN